jgi:aldehyde dehydrogenase (NAD+)
MKALLEKLGLSSVNPGGCTGPDRWLNDPRGMPLVSHNPATGEPIAEVIQSTAAAYDAVVQTAGETFRTWRATPAPQRGQVVRDLGLALREAKEPLGELVTVENGKIKAEGMGEVQEMIDICEFAAGLSRQLYGVTTQSERAGHRMYEQWHPLGVVGIITAFNFPCAVWSWNAAIAAVCGDTMVWKPASTVPLTALAVQHICNRVSADHGVSGVFNVVIGSGNEVGERMLNDDRLPLVSFTGSVRMGRHAAESVARRLGRAVLELGGNNGIIVSEDADLDLAVRAIVFGAVGTAGQRCTSTRRIIMQRSIAPALTRRLVKAYEQVTVGNPLDDGVLMGPLVNEAAVDAMMAALETIKAQGGEILFGGRRLPEKGRCFVAPTLVRMPRQTPIVLEETFAPILYLMEYETLDEAIAFHNEVPQGLSSAIFSTSLLTVERFLSTAGSDCGMANVNVGTSGAEIGLAFGGEKQTGGGREAGSDAWKAYMRRQSNVINWSRELPLAQGIKFGD